MMIESAAILGAKATLLAFRAACPLDEQELKGLTVIAPDGSRLTGADAVLTLAAMLKPVVCTSEVQEHVLIVRCHYMADADADAWRTWIDGGVASSAERLRREYHKTLREYFSLLLRGIDDVFLLDVDQYVKWSRDYDLRAVTRIIDGPDARTRELGASALVTFGPPATIRSWVL